MENMKTNETKLTKKDINSLSRRWIMGSQVTWNYERQMGVGYLWAMLPIIRKLYKDPKDQKEMLKTHVQFFNTTPHMGGFILGIDAATEEHEGMKAKEAVKGLKTGLMGPFAGVGDTLFGVLFPTIFGSIAAYMGQEGNMVGAVIWLLVNIAILIFRTYSAGIGYQEGSKIITSAKDKLDALTAAATLLGITVVGALIATVVKANVTATFVSGEISVKGQEILDQIMPCLIPAAVVGGVYWLLGRKKMTSSKAILLVMILSIVLHAIAIFMILLPLH